MTCASSCFIRCHSRFVLISTLLISSVLTGCGGTQPIGSSTEPTIAITASPVSVMAGSSTTLTVTAANATTVAIAGTDGSAYSLSATGGLQTVSPSTSATYTATAIGPGGKASAAASVTVTANPAPTVTISASPASIASGASSALTVAATNATGVTVTGSDGSTYTLAATGGTQTVSPSATTTYQATATGAGGKTSASATVTVTANPEPTVTISASPTGVMAGISSTLAVSATNATAVTVTGTDGSSYNLQAAGGSQIVTPSTSTTYTATATGPGGNATATAAVSVTYPAPAVNIGASPASITSGNASTLTVTAVNATQVSVAGSDGTSYPLAASGGTQVVTPTATTIYTASASGAGGTATFSTTVTVTANPAPNVSIVANPTSIFTGGSSTLTVTAEYATQVTVTGSDGSSYPLSANSGTQTLSVSPTESTTYTVLATGNGGNSSQTATVTVKAAGTVQSIQHVIFMLQENHTFDNYFGMLNPYRKANGLNIGDDGKEYDVDGIDDKLSTIRNADDEGTSYPLFRFTSTCMDDDSSDWLASFGDVNRYDFLTTRAIKMDGFVHNAEGYAKSCGINGVAGSCSGVFSDQLGQRAMGYYDQGFLNYYYYMASQFAVSDRWFSPVASKSIDNRIATFTGGTTQGLVKDPGGDDHLGGQLAIETIFKELDDNKVTWKIYYTVTQGFCLNDDDCVAGPSAWYPATDFSNLSYSYLFLHGNPNGVSCAPLQPSSVVGDPTNSFCLDSSHIAPIATYYTDLTNGTLPQFAFIEPGYANNDEHPGSGQSILQGQIEVAKVVNAFMLSSSWSDSVFFLAYDEGGGPYDHVPPVPGHSNDFTDTALGTIPDIASIAVNPDLSSANPPTPIYLPCVPTGGTPTLHCDLGSEAPEPTPEMRRRSTALLLKLASACRTSSSRLSRAGTMFPIRQWTTRRSSSSSKAGSSTAPHI